MAINYVRHVVMTWRHLVVATPTPRRRDQSQRRVRRQSWRRALLLVDSGDVSWLRVWSDSLRTCWRVVMWLGFVNFVLSTSSLLLLVITNSFLSHHKIVFLDPETGPQWPRTLFLLLSDFRSPKALSFLNWSSWNFSHILMTIFCIKLPRRIFDLGPS